jgi:hypothetical protein
LCRKGDAIRLALNCSRNPNHHKTHQRTNTAAACTISSKWTRNLVRRRPAGAASYGDSIVAVIVAVIIALCAQRIVIIEE